jgi:16S rRNA (adenine(1408)-N(1))-methyltransferase
MEIIRGKHALFMDSCALGERLAGYNMVQVDIGTGDGRFVWHMARACPDGFTIGIDANRDNLRQTSRCAPANALFIIANARSLPYELQGLASHITINFPWGSLLEGLLEHDAALLTGLCSIAQPGTGLEIHVNGGALAEAGWLLETGARRIRDVLTANGFIMQHPTTLTTHELRSVPTTWAKRLAFGRDPRAVYMRGVKK